MPVLGQDVVFRVSRRVGIEESMEELRVSYQKHVSNLEAVLKP
jgi:hypothetical protein